MGLDNQAIEQAVVVQQDQINYFQASKKLAIFNLDGTPFVPMTSDAVQTIVNDSIQTEVFPYVASKQGFGEPSQYGPPLQAAREEDYAALTTAVEGDFSGWPDNGLATQYNITGGAITPGSFLIGDPHCYVTPQASGDDVVVIGWYIECPDDPTKNAGLFQAFPATEPTNGVRNSFESPFANAISGSILQTFNYYMMAFCCKLDEDNNVIAPDDPSTCSFSDYICEALGVIAPSS